jgi:hypothetical protein
MKIKMILDAFVNDNVMKDLSPYGVKDKSLKWPRPPAKVKGCAFYGMVISDSVATFTAKTKRQIKQVNEQSRDWFTEVMLDAKKLGELKEGVSVTEAVDFYSDQMLLMQMMRRMSFSKEHMLKATSMIMKSLFAEGVLAVKH